jgi:surface carbohydrate biosynthesis protein
MIRQVYIPIEVKNRELKSRLLVLYFLLKKGHNCVIGDKSGVYRYMINNPGGIYYDKSISINKISFIKKIKKIARNIVCSDEELGITYNNIERFFKFRISLPTLRETTHFYCCGNRDYNYLLGEYSNQKDKFKLTGSAQFDLIKDGLCESIYKNEISNIKLKYGNFILVNSSFSIISKERARFHADLALKLNRINKNEYKSRFKELSERYVDFTDFIDIINRLSSDFPHLKFILRPHPTEDIAIWNSQIKNRNNIIVIKDGDVIPWIYASKVMIHEGCTTAIYAYLLKKKVISFIPKSKISKVANLTQSIGFQVKSYSDLKNVLTNEKDYEIGLNSLIPNVLQLSKTEFSANLIAEEISKLEINNTKIDFLKMIYYKYLILVNFISRKRIKLFSNNNTNDKIPDGIHEDEITSFLNTISAFFANDFKFTVKSIDKNTFEIYKKV